MKEKQSKSKNQGEIHVKFDIKTIYEKKFTATTVKEKVHVSTLLYYT